MAAPRCRAESKELSAVAPDARSLSAGSIVTAGRHRINRAIGNESRIMNANEWLQDLSRIDFVTSVGLHVMHDRIVLVRLRKNFQSVKLLEQEACDIPEGDGKQDISGLTGWIPDDVREIALKAEHDTRERALRQAILSLIPRFNPARDAFYICVPQEEAIVQQIFL